MADRAEDGVGGIAGNALGIAATKMAIGFHVTDHGFDSGAAPEFALDDAEDATLLPGDEEAVRV